MSSEDDKFDINEYLFNRYPEQFSAYLRGRVVETPTAWDRLVVNYVDTLVSVFPEIRFSQIKEKFGVLRCYYTHTYGDDVNDLITEITSSYETLTTKICCKCGSSNNVSRNKGYWVNFVCEDHKTKE